MKVLFTLFFLFLCSFYVACADIEPIAEDQTANTEDKIGGLPLDVTASNTNLTCSPASRGKDPNGVHNLGNQKHFEGWYYRFADTDQATSWVMIVAYWKDRYGSDRAFIELLHDPSGRVYKKVYENFDIKYVQSQEGNFELWVGDSFFSADEVFGSFVDDHGVMVDFDVKISQCARWGAPFDEGNRWTMGYATDLPLIPLKWHVHHLKGWSDGVINIDNTPHQLNRAATHQEKNWGTEFPSEWIWMQSNVFEGRPDVTFALAGGPVKDIAYAPDGYMLGIRWRDQFINWRTQNGHLLAFKDVNFYVNQGIATWTLTVAGAMYKAQVIATAPANELIQVDIPADGGLKIGAVEHLSADVEIILSKRDPSFTDILRWKEFDRLYTSRAAVEAGGEYAKKYGLIP